MKHNQRSCCYAAGGQGDRSVSECGKQHRVLVKGESFFINKVGESKLNLL